ncbi:carbohydrate ABC transporter permease [Ktedonosporobacter rubrisoli]|uniref:Carbohydrate ABC transporter permease n=1 Tax=Ktedonosporobacter rubrisoli TaxID=2509675 RepID=A0A4P6JJ23_KTERU|nr:carbohydrate ABC transporter permease [Ktedonosporobacter rubrisoli]QBD74656.1 carbohydrate ABC transporter permease [Ktedonosporobacter rubrisoli]
MQKERRRRFLQRLPGYSLWYLVLTVGAFLSLFPYLLVLLTSFKPANQLFSGEPWSLPTVFTLQSYSDVLTQYNFPGYIAHTLLYAGFATLGQLVFGTFAAYAFARIEFPGREILFWLYLATMMVPNIVTLIPMFMLMRAFGWINTYYGLIIPSVLGSPYGIFLMRQFFRTIPQDLESSARIEGATTLQIITHLILPLSRPILATLAIITFVQAWNDFLWPLIVTYSDALKVLTVGVSSFQSMHGAQWNLMMAATFIILGPLLLLFFVFQKQIVRSIHLSGFK